MADKVIGPVRPLFKLGEAPISNKKCERIIAGTPSSGMYIDITKEGIELNSYYTGFTSETKYSVFTNPVVISWEDLDKMKSRLKNRKSKVITPDRIEDDIDTDYLKSLPIVTINNNKFYIDPERRERRLVGNPRNVWRF
jgi:hypothetical protein